jgi:HK97 family phage major capsid protein
MKKSDQLRQERASKRNELQNIIKKVEAETRDLTDAEKIAFDNLDQALEIIEEDLQRAIKAEQVARQAAEAASEETDERNKRPAGTAEKREYKTLLREASAIDFLRAAQNLPVTGASAELIQEAQKRASQTGLELRGVAVPPEFLAEKRTPSTVYGSNTSVSSPQGELIDALRPVSTVVSAGARVLSGLNGTVVMPRLKAGTAIWEAETTNNTTASGAGLDGVKLEPKRLTALTSVSKMLSKVSGNLALENIFVEDLMLAQGEALDKAALAGPSGGNSPVGVLNMSNTGSVVIGATGGAITRAKVLEMLKVQADNNAWREGLKFITSNRSFYNMASITLDAGSGRFLQQDGRIEGIDTMSSVHVPINLTKGSGSNLSALILGWWQGLYIAQFGMFDLVVDPYSLATSGQDRVVLNGYWDIKAAHPTFFTVLKDITT